MNQSNPPHLHLGPSRIYPRKASFLRANLRIVKQGIAETEILDAPLIEGMRKSIELFQPKTPTVIPRKFLMEGGL